MLSFPFNSSSTVMWYNKDAFKKAGLDPDKPPKTWPEVFEAAKKLKAAGPRRPAVSRPAWITWVNIEQFSAWHNVPLGDEGERPRRFRHRAQDQLAAAREAPPEPRRAAEGQDLRLFRPHQHRRGPLHLGECPILLTSSAFFGNVKANAKFDFATRRCPTIPTSPGAPQNSIIGGASLWVMGGKTPDEYKGVAKFFTFLSDTDRQAKLHQESGYLPITKAAYEKTKASGFYEKNPVPRDAAARAHQQGADRKFPRPSPRQHGADARRLVRGDRERRSPAQKTAKEALDSAVGRGNRHAAPVRAHGA